MDYVLPVDNGSLIETVNNVKSQNIKTPKVISGKTENDEGNNKNKKHYDEMNSIISHI